MYTLLSLTTIPPPPLPGLAEAALPPGGRGPAGALLLHLPRAPSLQHPEPGVQDGAAGGLCHHAVHQHAAGPHPAQGTARRPPTHTCLTCCCLTATPPATRCLPPAMPTARDARPPRCLPPAAHYPQCLPPLMSATRCLPPAARYSQCLPPLMSATRCLPPRCPPPAACHLCLPAARTARHSLLTTLNAAQLSQQLPPLRFAIRSTSLC